MNVIRQNLENRLQLTQVLQVSEEIKSWMGNPSAELSKFPLQNFCLSGLNSGELPIVYGSDTAQSRIGELSMNKFTSLIKPPLPKILALLEDQNWAKWCQNNFFQSFLFGSIVDCKSTKNATMKYATGQDYNYWRRFIMTHRLIIFECVLSRFITDLWFLYQWAS